MALGRVDELISAQVRRTPDAVAVVFGSQLLTYRELERQADWAATRLREMGVARGSLVGVHLERSLEMLIAIIAVMKAGGAYVPLDPDFPADRLAHMVSDSGLELVVTQATLQASAPPGDYRKVGIENVLSGVADGVPGVPCDAVALGGADEADLVYVLYTSGSSGKPKGVALEHRNVVNFLLSMQCEPGLTPQDRLLAVTTLSFDIAGLELYLPLITGATVVIAGREEAADGIALRALIDTHRATVMQATPTTWRLLIEAGWEGSPEFKVLCGGEALPKDLAQKLLQRCGELWNMYGPTETTIWSTLFQVVDRDAPVLIGRPIANTRIYVLDRSGRPVPTGVPGELHIAGAGVARGYLNRPDLTAEKFVRDPLCNVPGGRMYRTGDSGRFLADGNLEFRTRIDNQVKIRGFRVELGEVEAAMESHPAVKQAIAKIFEIQPGDMRLVAYILPQGAAPSAAELREHLRAQLPHYMVPQHFPIVAEFPLTPNGKVDRGRLVAPQAMADLDDDEVEPRTETERMVVDLFREMLAIERVSADVSFFDLGGHSILAARVASQLRRKHHPGITLRMIFDAPTAIALASEIEKLTHPGVADDAGERQVFEF